MEFTIKHETKRRMRISTKQSRMTYYQADMLLYYLYEQDSVSDAKVYERTGDAVILYTGNRSAVIEALLAFCYDDAANAALVPDHTGRELNAEYQEKLISKVVFRIGSKILLPGSLRMLYVGIHSIKYILKGIRCLAKRKLEVSVLDATAIGVSLLRGDFGTAGSIMFLLGIGETLEEWTHKKSVDDLARSMSLNIDKVWLKKNDTEVLVKITDIREDDEILVHMGNIIPLDGIVASGEALVNQASLTGESVSVKKEADAYVYAGTVVEEGELTVCVKQISGSTKFEKIVTMIEESEKLKSSLEGKAEHLADALVPYSFAGTVATYLFTRDVTRALSVLMVDFSCALKLAMPIAVLSAMREAGTYHIMVKGGKYLEAIADADTIVFDKTGTLTKAQPTVARVIAFDGNEEREMLKIAACLEEHFPHSMANAVVNEAKRQKLSHEEMHSNVQYMVAHGISSEINGKRAVIGSAHFVFDDENCRIPEAEAEKYASLPEEYSHLYLAMDGVLCAVICIEDPLREEAGPVMTLLREAGISKIVMMTGDSDRTAKAIAKKVGVDEYYSEVLPEDKAKFVEREKKKGRKVIMVGDGINDSPALSAADVGIAISEGAQLAREIADITISADNLNELVTLKRIGNGLMQRIRRNYRFVISFNFCLILLGVGGIIPPTTSALLHNSSTLGISLSSMKNLLS
ncbi:heavy metal translocating P-type ATPase [Hespellia stercorisuis]|uniref:Cd(2+)-exporting ATPase n=1 Tax=Hespellia stercorisuis DSM 15480 TaxID=1121950 RepID=A0A1M6PGP9_9FIRM|nr:heavy metal translocating P-type ATPase [Hespellia stercorisuis]SHK07119.1 ATPase, P-type (transporting), HAD superfamily, subfamily IC/heavy metal translocating P-type ATPase [Hespellia stercorisuis DSM 15480]